MGMDRQRGKHQAGKAAVLTGEDQPFVPFRFECVASRGSLAAEYEGGEGCMCCALTLLGSPMALSGMPQVGIHPSGLLPLCDTMWYGVLSTGMQCAGMLWMVG